MIYDLYQKSPRCICAGHCWVRVGEKNKKSAHRLKSLRLLRKVIFPIFKAFLWRFDPCGSTGPRIAIPRQPFCAPTIRAKSQNQKFSVLRTADFCRILNRGRTSLKMGFFAFCSQTVHLRQSTPLFKVVGDLEAHLLVGPFFGP